MTSKLIKKIHMECPLCGQVHDIELRSHVTTIMIKGEEVQYEEQYMVCLNSPKDENVLVTGKMENENLLNARNAYRIKKGLLTSYDIVEIRELYGLTQVELAKLLGWGEATISRYESKAIQDEAYDNVLRMIKENPLLVMDFLQKNHSKFSSFRYEEIAQLIISKLDTNGIEYLQRKSLEGKYIKYQNPCDENGNCILNVDKIETIISYLASHMNGLNKVKLMNLLWYVDVITYSKINGSLTGLVYTHEVMGVLPIGHYDIMGLPNVIVQEEYENEYIKYHILPNNSLSDKLLNNDEEEILNEVIEKFKSYTAKEIVEYIQKETPYLKTNDLEVIPFSIIKI